VNASDSHPHGSTRKKGCECVRGVEGGSDYERLLHEDAPSKKMLRSKEEEGCVNASVNEDANGYPASANESGGARLNVSEGEILNSGNESVND